MIHKGFQIRPCTRDACFGFGPDLSDRAAGPDDVVQPVTMACQFPEENGEASIYSESSDDSFADDPRDPDWCPDSDVSSDEDEAEDDWYYIWLNFLK